ncbi:hypothetical protein ACFQ3W_23450 [Paenibacillus puldeungensis]|uniref:Uncharacterized protein n=1 Tax=Paenibacillus puldeungensis TaxID=696536 RepID=A0ABW3S3D8_9BACL
MITGNYFTPDKNPILTICSKGGKEILRFDPSGDIFVHGKLVENDKEVVQGFRKFLVDQGYLGSEGES